MNLILFPTRFYPAISGGDFFLQRIGEEFKKKNRDNVQFITSNALDFSSIHNKGKIVPIDHCNYADFRGISISRYECISSEIDNRLFLKESGDLQKFVLNNISLDPIYLHEYIRTGPILKDFLSDINKKKDIYDWFRRKEKIQNDKPTILHTTYLPYLNILYSYLLARKYNLTKFITPFIHSENTRYQNELHYQIINQFDGIFLRTNVEKEFLITKKISPTKIHVIPMGVDVEKFQLPSLSHKSLNFNLKKYRVLFCGYKNFEKGAISLLKTIPLFNKMNLEISFIFIGPSTTSFNYEFSRIKKEINDNLNIINITPDNLSGIYDPIKLALFRQCDIYCMPSRSDAYGISYLEAWASKKPVIAANFPAMREVIHEKKDGLLVEFDNQESIMNSIVNLLSNDELRKSMGEYGFIKVKKNNTWDVISKQIHSIYEKASEVNAS